MNGNETVKYLKSKYQEGQDYGHIAVIVKKSAIEVWHAVPAMVEELKGIGFEEQGYCCRKSWEDTPQPPSETNQEPDNAWQRMLQASAKKRAQINFDAETYGSKYDG